MDNNIFSSNGWGNTYLSFDELARLRDGKTIQKKANRTKIEVDKDSYEEFPATYFRGIITTGELADMVVDRVADVFGRDVKGIAEECMNMHDLQILCFKLVFCNGPKGKTEKAVEDVTKPDANNVIDSLNLINQAMRTGTIQNQTIKLTNKAIDFLVSTLYNDNEVYNDTSNNKFINKYVSYEYSVVDGKTPFIACHGVSLEKACEFVFGPASYSVKVGAGRNENGRILEVERLTHEDTKKVIRKIAGVRANSENLRTPQFTNI